ncbi:MAG TPA: hypothetical protein VGC42_22615 [Kofleriaceae bacterium]
MATKRAPKESSISRTRTVAYARKTRPTSEAEAAAPEDPPAEDDTKKDADAAEPEAAEAEPEAAEADAAEPAPEAAPAPTPDPAELPKLHADEPDPERARSDTVMMSTQASIGAPPAMPDAPPADAPGDVEAAESPTHMPGPREIPSGKPDDPARPPGVVPRGDSRSMRRRAERYEFALIYRMQNCVISRFGVVGSRGQWRVVEYPTSSAAGHAYAREYSRFAADGFSDYRE